MYATAYFVILSFKVFTSSSKSETELVGFTFVFGLPFVLSRCGRKGLLEPLTKRLSHRIFFQAKLSHTVLFSLMCLDVLVLFDGMQAPAPKEENEKRQSFLENGHAG